jgi:hypothetical protein
MVSPKIHVEGPSDREVISGILRKFSWSGISVSSGYGSYKGRDAVIGRIEVIAEDSRFDKFLIILDEDARRKLQDKAQQVTAPPSKPVYVILIPSLEDWVRQLLDPADVGEYGRRLKSDGKVGAARWAVNRFHQARLKADPVVQEVLDFCQCRPLAGRRFPEAFR